MDRTTWVYILECADGRYYVGTHRGEDVNDRVSQHQEGWSPTAFTYKRRPVKLVWARSFQDAMSAIAMERRLKRWTRAKKEAFMREDWAGLQDLARSRRGRNPRPSTGSG
jgi:putative endonuclease